MRFTQRIWITATAFAITLAATAGYRVVRSGLAEQVYRDRLREVHRSYEHLRTSYNHAVRRTAVTELIVDGRTLSVAIRTAEGLDRIIPTPFDPYGEVYIDYIVLDGRLWIRRVFDAATPPDQAVIIDPMLDRIDWQSAPQAVGKAVYRRLDQGRWIVTVTGDGSLGLTQIDPDATIDLTPAPPVRDYPQIERELDARIDRIGPLDVLQRGLGLDPTR